MIAVGGLDAVDSVEPLFRADPMTNLCWCMWFIGRVRDFHDSGPEGNRQAFMALGCSQPLPLGLLALDATAAGAEEPVGWCAVGPRSRYDRAIRTPTYRGRAPAEDDEVWLVPCLYVRPDRRGEGLSEVLLRGAIGLATSHGAVALEGFPLCGQGRQGHDLQVGLLSTFTALGFEVTRQNSSRRAVVRLGLSGCTSRSST